MKILHQVQNALQKLNGYEVPYEVVDFLALSEDRDQLLIREDSSEAEVMLCLQEARLERLSDKNFPADFQLSLLPDLGIVIEELSHFNTYCLSALQQKEISPLELEVQGEVDRFGVALDFLQQQNQMDLQEKLFEILFNQCQLGDWVNSETKERYEDAHFIARNFCRSILQKAKNSPDFQKDFRQFFASSRGQKLSQKY